MVRVIEEHGSAEDWYRAGNRREDEGRDDEALACFERAVALDPAHARAWNNLGAACQRLGDLRRAEEAYRRAVARDPALVPPSVNLGRLCEGRGDYAGAAACYRAALDRHPGDDMLRHLFAAASGENPERAPRDYVQSLFDAQAPRFDAHLVQDLGYRVPERLAELLRPALGIGPARVLDLGCGTGLAGAALAGPGIELVGVDLSPAMLQQASRRGIYARLLQADVLEALAQGAAGEYAAVVAADVFIYIGELGDVFEGVARALAAGGRFAFSIEALDGGTYRLRPSGRYAHALDYVRALGAACGMAFESATDTRIRGHGAGGVDGRLVLMRKA